MSKNLIRSLATLTVSASFFSCTTTQKNNSKLTPTQTKTQTVVFSDSEVPAFQKTIKNGKVTVVIQSPNRTASADAINDAN